MSSSVDVESVTSSGRAYHPRAPPRYHPPRYPPPCYHPPRARHPSRRSSSGKYSRDSGLSDSESGSLSRMRTRRRCAGGGAGVGAGAGWSRRSRAESDSSRSMHQFRATCMRAFTDQQEQIAHVARLCRRLMEREERVERGRGVERVERGWGVERVERVERGQHVRRHRGSSKESSGMSSSGVVDISLSACASADERKGRAHIHQVYTSLTPPSPPRAAPAPRSRPQHHTSHSQQTSSSSSTAQHSSLCARCSRYWRAVSTAASAWLQLSPLRQPSGAGDARDTSGSASTAVCSRKRYSTEKS